MYLEYADAAGFYFPPQAHSPTSKAKVTDKVPTVRPFWVTHSSLSLPGLAGVLSCSQVVLSSRACLQSVVWPFPSREHLHSPLIAGHLQFMLALRQNTSFCGVCEEALGIMFVTEPASHPLSPSFPSPFSSSAAILCSGCYGKYEKNYPRIYKSCNTVGIAVWII